MVKQILKEMSKLSPVMQFGRKLLDKEEFGEDSCNNVANIASLVNFFWTIVTLVAVYLSFKCKNKFDLGQFLIALFCAPFYIAYRLAVPCVKLIN